MQSVNIEGYHIIVCCALQSPEVTERQTNMMFYIFTGFPKSTLSHGGSKPFILKLIFLFEHKIL